MRSMGREGVGEGGDEASLWGGGRPWTFIRHLRVHRSEVQRIHQSCVKK